jgi:hypothetical protein
VPLWLKVGVTGFVCVLVPVYAAEYGFANFLWFSNIALLGGMVALWLESRLLAGMMALAVVLPEMAWVVDLVLVLVGGGAGGFGLTGYMFDEGIPLGVRLLSLYHIPLPVMLVWMAWRLGYDGRALWWQTAVAWVVLPLSWVVSDAEANINWVYGLADPPQTWMPPVVYVGVLMVGFVVVVYLPTHGLMRLMMRWRGSGGRG